MAQMLRWVLAVADQSSTLFTSTSRALSKYISDIFGLLVL